MAQISIAALVAAVRSGESLISFPTDTVPAMATLPAHAAQIFAAKQRQPDKPLILMAAQAQDLWPFVQGTQQERALWQAMADQYWPGALTLVLPASHRVPAVINPLDPTTIGLRVPRASLAQLILQQTGPLATTSVNRSGQPALESLADINADFPQLLTPLASQWRDLPMGNKKPALPSTVAQWTNPNWTILRQGTLYLDK
ncbi:MAG: L-threonylcarbamoyladenylate synthase [Acaryochloridaceae cyanobacterium SU_2_1]|nr:L-threonylcarbamoyladenylate synthase [Acaryochloridaceae cyanobacterium SU_2_1]NJM95579.1 L-threonylcarbamoyladenylate synthase [Acaryochloridaceae cyanobacterium CSU_5_19]